MSEFNERERVLEGARTIRGVLPELLGEQAPLVDARIAALLESARQGFDVHTQLLQEISAKDETRLWLAHYLGMALIEKSFRGLPGDSSAIPAEKFICPQGDFVWYRRDSSIPVPVCPTHLATLKEP